MRLREDAIERENGVHGIYGVVEKQDCAIILPSMRITSGWSNSIGIQSVRERLSFRREAGKPTTSTRSARPGELNEETGLIAGRMTALPWMWIAYGFSRQRQHVFIAEDLTMGTRSAIWKNPICRSSACPSRFSNRSCARVRFAMHAPSPLGEAISCIARNTRDDAMNHSSRSVSPTPHNGHSTLEPRKTPVQADPPRR